MKLRQFAGLSTLVITATTLSLQLQAAQVSAGRDVYVDARPPEVIAWRRSALIPFPDGSSMEVLLRRTPPVIGPVTASLASEYPALQDTYRAGNPDAAYALY